MKKHLFINYYSDKNDARKEELLLCVNSNIYNDCIDEVHIFLENVNHASDIEPNKKIKFIYLGRRLEFVDVFDYISANINEESIAIISNLDIFLENSNEWMNIDRDFFNVGHPDKAMVCCRYNLDKNFKVTIEEDSWVRGEFCDVWVFKTPVKQEFLKENLRFCVGGAPQCDNTMMYLMSKYYHTYSWGSKYKVYHYDVCRKENGPKMILNDQTDMRPSKRKREHISISAYQDWERFLSEKKEPQYVPTWRIVYKDGSEICYVVN